MAVYDQIETSEKAEAGVSSTELPGVLAAAKAVKSSGVSDSDISETMSVAYNARIGKLSTILRMIHTGQNVAIACEGDSLTYGQDTSGDGTTDYINGATQPRSVTPWPETMDAVVPDLAKWGSDITVENRGYPGDTTGLAITRWASASAVDLVFMMYGTNDANGYGGTTTDFDDFKPNYRTLIERRLAQGSTVVLMVPPRLRSTLDNAVLQPYRLAVVELAAEYDLLCIDVNDLLSLDKEDCWYDGVHFKARSYADIGWNLSALLCDQIYDVEDGTLITAQHNPWTTTNKISDENYRYGMVGVVKGVDQGFGKERRLYVAVRAKQDVTIALDMHSADAGSKSAVVRTYYGDTDYTGNGPGGDHSSKIVRFGNVTPGLRLIKIETTSSNDAYLNAIEFKNFAVATEYQSYPIAGFAGLRKLTTLPPGAYDVFSNRQYFADFIFQFNFSNLNDSAWQGAFIATEPYREGGNPSGVLVLRKGGSNLLIRKITAGSNDGDLLDVGGVFPGAGDWSGVITVHRNDTGWLFYVDGTLQHTETTGITSAMGYPGVRLNSLTAQVDSVIVQD